MSDIGFVLKQAVQQLGEDKELALREAEIILGHILGKNRAYLFAHSKVQITAEQAQTYQSCIEQRKQGLPIAYITGQREFWSLPLKVNQATLIPRHETERLVELALELLPNTANTHILDLGTGSGAIALALAKERPKWQITACDISESALKIARENASNLHLHQIKFYHSDWFCALPKQTYQAIIANPPYIAEQDPHLQEGDLRFEPLNALVSSQEGLADLQYIITQGYEYLVPHGLLLVEHGYDQKDPIRAILQRSGYEQVDCWQDIQGHSRVSGGYKPL